jgi:hypothetical protein
MLSAPLLGAMGLVLALIGCGGGAASTPADPGNSTALLASRPGELAQYVQAKLRAREAQRAAGVTTFYATTGPTDTAPSPALGAAPPAAMRSSTLVQEAGVDEPDLLQSDGQFIYTLKTQTAASGASVPGSPVLRLQVHGRHADGSLTALKTLDLPVDTNTPAGGFSGGVAEGMVLSDDHKTLAVLSQRWQSLISPLPVCSVAECSPAIGLPFFAPPWLRNTVDVQRVDVGQPANASAGERISIDGRLVNSRRIGDLLYVVTSHVPRLPVDLLPFNASAADREATIAKLGASDVLPSMRRVSGGSSSSNSSGSGSSTTPLLADTDCWLQPTNGSLAVEITTITVFDLRSTNLANTSRCFVGGTEALYMTANHLYLATTRTLIQPALGKLSYPPQVTTSIHKFKLAAGSVAYRASGEVPGHLGWNTSMKSYRFSEAGDDLRVLTYTGNDGWVVLEDANNPSAGPPSPARLTVLRERASATTPQIDLQEVAALPNTSRPAALGKPGEQVHGVRFVGDRGYLVTFRRTDPLFLLDLANPADPKVAGTLEVTGFSDHLFPLANGLLVGVGKDANSAGRVLGLKLALFDVRDPALPTQAASITLGEAGSQSALDHSRHGLNLLDTDGAVRIALPVNLLSHAGQTWIRGLQGFEVDTRARSLRLLALLGAAPLTGTEALWSERSLQIDNHVCYANGAGLQGFVW